MSSSPQQRLPYAAALDGLRAIAVIAVIGYHLDIGWMQGGFLGVDLFFVISGFLITRLLLGEHAAGGRIALGSFWVRRFRRLVPPLVLVVAASVAATRLWGLPAQWDAMRGDAVASLGYVANWRFVLNDTSYFETLLGPSPLRHIWSLAVEEQWYLIWPLVMAALTPWAVRRDRRGATALLLAGAAVLSALWMAVLYDPADLSRVYYGTDTRAQQLLVGAVLAWLSVASPRWFDAERLRRVRVPLNVVLVGFVVATVAIDDEAAWLYRGGLLGLSIGAALLVAGASVPGSAGPLGWLAARPLVALGRRSYSLYLWHWPVIVFVGPPIGLDLPTVPLAAVQVGVSLVFTEATYRWVERPIRHGSSPPRRVVAAWTTAAALTAVGATTTLTSTAASALPDIDVLRPTISTSIPGPTGTSTSIPTQQPPAPIDFAQAPPAVAAAAPPETIPPSRRMLLVGDSTALVLAEGRPDDRPSAWESIEYARAGCAITDGDTVDVGEDKITWRDTATCAEWAQDWSALSSAYQPTLSVIMVGAWEVLDHVVEDRRLSFPDPDWTAHVEHALERGIEAATNGGGHVAFLRLPCMEQPHGSLSNAQARNDQRRVDAFNDLLEEVADRSPLVTTMPLDDVLCPDGQPLGAIDGEAVRYDGVHLSDAGTRLVWDWLDDQLTAFESTVS